jgi:translation initiation factor 3 subunit L
MASTSDAMLPKALTDFVYDLYDSVTLSQLSEEQAVFYDTDFPDLTKKYFASQPWPSPESIASECNGHPLFLAVYRELTHRHLHSVSRPTLRDRVEGWQVYRELFEEILEADDPNYYLLPSWIFDILHEFVYQFQGFCQIRSALYATGRKHGILQQDGTIDATASASAAASGQHSNLVDNLNTLQSSSDAWDVEMVFSYLNRLVQIGTPKADGKAVQPVYSYLSLFSSVALSRLECILGDYTASLQALTPIVEKADLVIPKEEGATHMAVLTCVFPARLSMAYHAGVSFMMLRRYRDAAKSLGDVCAFMQRGFKTGQLRKLPGSDQFNKQYERMLSLLAICVQICPSCASLMDDPIVRLVREKHGSKLEAAVSYEDWFQSPKFVAVDPTHATHRQQVQMFLKGMEKEPAGHKLRSYLKLYTSLQVEKLAKFHDMTANEDFLPLLLSYKARMRQMERSGSEKDTYIEGTMKSALDIHCYLEGDMVHVDEAEKQRRFENYFVNQIMQNTEIRRDAVTIDTNV